MDPFRRRLLPRMAVLVGSPICAEYLQAYLPSTGDLPTMLGSLIVLGPLYGGAALLIREAAVRRQLAWTGVLILAAAFGLLMPGDVDLALFGQHRSDIDYWDALREGTLIAPLGISAYGAITWTVSHMVPASGRHWLCWTLLRRGIEVGPCSGAAALRWSRSCGSRPPR